MSKGAAGTTITCQELVELVTEYLEGALDVGTAAEIEAHLALCGGCEQYVAQIRETVRLLRQMPAGGLGDTARAEILTAFRRTIGSATMTDLPDHELEVLEDDETVPPRPEEVIADAARESPSEERP